jgi:hypothetical protein
MYIINAYNTATNDIRAEPVGELMSRCTRKTKSQKGQYSACITNVETRPGIGVVPIQRTVTSNETYSNRISISSLYLQQACHLQSLCVTK